jgi:hypothetical protein
MGGYVFVLLGVSSCEGKVVNFVGSLYVANNPKRVRSGFRGICYIRFPIGAITRSGTYRNRSPDAFYIPGVPDDLHRSTDLHWGKEFSSKVFGHPGWHSSLCPKQWAKREYRSAVRTKHRREAYATLCRRVAELGPR